MRFDLIKNNLIRKTAKLNVIFKTSFEFWTLEGPYQLFSQKNHVHSFKLQKIIRLKKLFGIGVCQYFFFTFYRHLTLSLFHINISLNCITFSELITSVCW